MPRKGERMSPEHKSKIAAAHRGKKQPWMAGERNPAKRPEVRAKLSAALRGVSRPKGSDAWNWKGRDIQEKKLCECGCGILIFRWQRGGKGYTIDHENRFVLGHHLKGKPRPDFSTWVQENARANFDQRKHPRGEIHWNWKGGITEREHLERNSPRYRAWRDAVYARDHWRCVVCGRHLQKGDITADHIHLWKDRPKLRFDVSNGRTLCRKHHAIRHELGRDIRPVSVQAQSLVV